MSIMRLFRLNIACPYNPKKLTLKNLKNNKPFPEPAKKIKYFQMNSLKEANTQKESGKKNYINHKSSIDKNDSIDGHNKNKGVDSDDNNPQNVICNDENKIENLSVKNIKNKVNSRNELKDCCIENELENTIECENDNTKVGNVEDEPLNENQIINDVYSLNDGNNNANGENDTNDKQNLTDNIGNGTNDKNNGLNDKPHSVNDENSDINGKDHDENDKGNGKNDKQICTDDKDNNTHDIDEDIISNDNKNHLKINGKGDDDKIDDSDDDNSDSDSNYEPNSGDEPAPSKKMKFQTYQCYVCFKVCIFNIKIYITTSKLK